MASCGPDDLRAVTDESFKRSLRQALPFAIYSVRRLPHLGRSVVFELGTATDVRMIKLHPGPYDRYFAEARAYLLCETAHVSVPKVMWVGMLQVEGLIITGLCSIRVEGQVLEESRGAGLDLERVGVSLGRSLARVHGIEMQGFGLIDLNGDPSGNTWSDFVTLQDTGADLRDFVSVSGLTAAQIQTAFRLVARYADEVDKHPSHLIHADFDSRHVLVATLDRVALIDFEMCRGGDPMYDLALWSIFSDGEIPLRTILRGYRAVSDLAPSNAPRIRTNRVSICLRYLLFAATDLPSWSHATSHLREVLHRDIRILSDTC